MMDPEEFMQATKRIVEKARDAIASDHQVLLFSTEGGEWPHVNSIARIGGVVEFTTERGIMVQLRESSLAGITITKRG